MFTGLIEEIGKVKTINKGVNSYQFTIEAFSVLEGTKIGDSICTNGACLTVSKIQENIFTLDIMSETVSKTNFSQLQIGDAVNLERALKLSDRLGGHIVSGHIDGVGKIISLEKDDIAWVINIACASELCEQMIDKGSITIDGISLTIIKVEDNSFIVSLIPHTAKETTLLHKKVGDSVNLETDMIGKYVHRLLNISSAKKKEKSKIDINFLQQNGFI